MRGAGLHFRQSAGEHGDRTGSGAGARPGVHGRDAVFGLQSGRGGQCAELRPDRPGDRGPVLVGRPLGGGWVERNLEPEPVIAGLVVDRHGVVEAVAPGPVLDLDRERHRNAVGAPRFPVVGEGHRQEHRRVDQDAGPHLGLGDLHRGDGRVHGQVDGRRIVVVAVAPVAGGDQPTDQVVPHTGFLVLDFQGRIGVDRDSEPAGVDRFEVGRCRLPSVRPGAKFGRVGAPAEGRNVDGLERHPVDGALPGVGHQVEVGLEDRFNPGGFDLERNRCAVCGAKAGDDAAGIRGQLDYHCAARVIALPAHHDEVDPVDRRRAIAAGVEPIGEEEPSHQQLAGFLSLFGAHRGGAVHLVNAAAADGVVRCVLDHEVPGVVEQAGQGARMRASRARRVGQWKLVQLQPG